MGLDMYLFAETPLGEENVAYWRKHASLHGWMKRLYEERGGEEEFNCVRLELTRDDLLRLLEDIRNQDLPECHGLFFGHSYGDESEQDIGIFKQALTRVERGEHVFYSCWW